jgi:putative transposase
MEVKRNMKKATARKALPAGVAKVLKPALSAGRDPAVCAVVVAYPLSLRHLEMMAERGFEVDHSSVHRWVIKRVPQAHGKEVRSELTDRVQAA